MAISYNQIINASRAFANAHYRIKGHFGNGPLSDQVLHNQVEAFKYPLMWMEDLSMPVEPNTEIFAFRVSFSCPVADLKERGTDLMSTNVNEVKSDMIRCAKDFLAYWLMDTSYGTMYVEENANIQPFEDLTPDRLAGAYIDIRFRQAWDPNACAIPMSGVPAPENTCAPVYIYENDILVFTAPSGSEYRYTSSGSSFTYDLYFDGVDTGQDVVVDGDNIIINLT